MLIPLVESSSFVKRSTSAMAPCSGIKVPNITYVQQMFSPISLAVCLDELAGEPEKWLTPCVLPHFKSEPCQSSLLQECKYLTAWSLFRACDNWAHNHYSPTLSRARSSSTMGYCCQTGAWRNMVWQSILPLHWGISLSGSSAGSEPLID